MSTFQTLAIIPARGGSKGVPRKNVRELNDKPLIAHTIEQARAATHVMRVVVSTDDAEIGAVAEAYGAEVVWRPAALSDDTASSESALLHALDYLAEEESYHPDLVAFLQCTSPIREPDDIDRAIFTLLDQHADSLLSVVASHRFLWTVEDGHAKAVNYDYRKRPRRQERPPEFVENGSIYLFKPWVLRDGNSRLGGKIALYEMGPRSAVDVDTVEDIALCEWIISTKESGSNLPSRH